jgi:dolichol-phosphate mannosyltransferase
VIVPTYNEVETVESVVDVLVSHGVGVLIVDDSSEDGTGELADRLAAAHETVEVLHRPVKDGLGRALAAGYVQCLASGAAVVAQMDADGSHDPASLPSLLAAIDDGAGLAIGSRYVPGGSAVGLGPFRSFLSRAGNVYARIMLGFGVRDATSGFRAFRSDVLSKLPAAETAAEGYAFQIEMTWLSHRQGASIAEVPIEFHNRQAGASKMSTAIALEALWLVTKWGLSRLPIVGSRRRAA